jgi:transposase InsO family protein
VIVNRATGYAFVVPLRAKPQAPSELIPAIASLLQTTGKTVGRYHSDNARELQANLLVNTLRAQGPSVSATTPHSSQMNGHAERTIKTIFEATRDALAAASLPDQFWSLAAIDAT